MFDRIDEAGLVSTIGDAVRAEASAASLRLAAIGELMARRFPDEGADPRYAYAFDPWAEVAAEVSAAMTISYAKACGQMRIAEALRDRLPKVAALFGKGQLSERVVSILTWRTRNIVDGGVWAAVDSALAERAIEWGPLSQDDIVAAVDALIYQYDADAVITVKRRVKGRDFVVGAHEDEDGLTTVYGKLPADQAAFVGKVVAAVASTVCADDPRTVAQRRSDAFYAVMAGNRHLICGCGSPACPVADNPAPKSPVVINVLADEKAVDTARAYLAAAERDTACSGTSRADNGTAVMSDSTVVPTPLLAEMIGNGAKLCPLPTPTDPDPEPRYRPSAKLAAFIRARDLHCRAPGCRVPADRCDIDHVTPYPTGKTHASDLVCLCRRDHLRKTFLVPDWSLVLDPDGTATWTAPTGHTYTTSPGCRNLFPDWDVTTADLPYTAPPPLGPQRELKMPLRKLTRAKARLQRIKGERAENNSDPPNEEVPF
ncbi:HNH endonuclease signature motif containing protein [Mycolicibacterium celeriflavum]|uniref:HNH endonuclease n=1 Tax=Mycolicibacterium celeriflavum TaxID=1249101 RepID=A0A1X0BRB8_MYCCF|nr:HNH endonuclease signature motif containing protein [Mycolicibacterium celeriflavum]MCV7237976.1 DUF222 domain-containing protein [Mycolicibacterium celeriflavum]ORA45846.1 hypothetical protein BST21_16790 [Mycolicibacterium celeriflavum]BBY45486.1 HNH endonuclease [Mycolicibacterium celeriflavum]